MKTILFRVSCCIFVLSMLLLSACSKAETAISPDQSEKTMSETASESPTETEGSTEALTEKAVQEESTRSATIEDDSNGLFVRSGNGNYISPSGTEYTLLANEPLLYHLGEREFLAGVEGEEPTLKHLSSKIRTGFYALKNDPSHHILVRVAPDSEWLLYYRDVSLPPFDYSRENCSLLVLLKGYLQTVLDSSLMEFSEQGLCDKESIAEFYADILSQKSPEEAGLYDYVRQPDGFWKNCYTNSSICGFFEEEPDLFISMPITSYDDKAYSIMIGEQEYVLPDSWLERFNTP
ncbi:MAG: hypothetical protein IJK86_05235 [Lachnospiraceae bacterium]|nr:hypothetical protein [Lachnospiraceae bacterium]